MENYWLIMFQIIHRYVDILPFPSKVSQTMHSHCSCDLPFCISGLTKEIHFNQDDDNDDNQNDNKDDGHLSHSAMLDPNDDQFSNPKAMVQ